MYNTYIHVYIWYIIYIPCIYVYVYVYLFVACSYSEQIPPLKFNAAYEVNWSHRLLGKGWKIKLLQTDGREIIYHFSTICLSTAVFKAPCCGPRAPRLATFFWSAWGDRKTRRHWVFQTVRKRSASLSFPRRWASPTAMGSVPTPGMPVKPVSPPVVRPGIIIICGITPKAWVCRKNFVWRQWRREEIFFLL